MNIDIGSLVTIVVTIAVIYFIIKYIISPLVKLITGIVVCLIAIYILQHYFSFSFNQILGPAAKYVNIDQWIKDFTWAVNYVISFVTQLFAFTKFFNNGK